ncbi:MAG: trimethylamine methyltransferase family protein [Armatimonadota bacterium]
MKLQQMAVLSENEIKQIHEASLHILAHSGVKIYNKQMLQLLREAGLDVDLESNLARFSRECIENAINSIPSTFNVYDREGKFAFTLGDGYSRVAAGHNAVFWFDSETGQTRPSRISDIELFARLCESLNEIDVIGIPVMPQDGPDPSASLLYGVKACIEYCSKPIYFSTDKPDVNRACIKMIEAVFQGDLKSQVYGITQLSPTSPLFWEESVIEALIDSVNLGVPVAILPEPITGQSAPYTLAGLLTIDNAECLSGLVMTQLIKPGSKALYANSWTTTDMRTGSALVGSAETTLCRIAGAQLAKFYGVPSHTTAPNSDNHTHDEQNAWEKTFSQFCSIGAGNDLIVNCGMFATGMTTSHEQLIMDDEISAMSRRIVNGINVNDATIARDLIEEIGPHGSSYLTTDHTLEWLRSDEHLMPNLAVRGPFASWKNAGSKDTYQKAREMVWKFATKTPVKIDAERSQKLGDIIHDFDR